MSKYKPVPVDQMTPGSARGHLVDEWTRNDAKRAQVERLWPRLAELIEVQATASPYVDQRKQREAMSSENPAVKRPTYRTVSRDELPTLHAADPDNPCWSTTHMGRPCGPGCIVMQDVHHEQ